MPQTLCHTAGARLTHTHTHTGVHPYECKECVQRFSHLTNLHDHEWRVHHTHSGFKHQRFCCREEDAHLGDKVPGSHKGPDGKDYCYHCSMHEYPAKCRSNIRQEILVLAEVERLLPELGNYKGVWDCVVANICHIKKRPDMIWRFWSFLHQKYIFYLHFEIDECGNRHEQSRKRLQDIQRAVTPESYKNMLKGVVVRIDPNSSDSAPMLTRKHSATAGKKIFSANGKHFTTKMQQVADWVRLHLFTKEGGINTDKAPETLAFDKDGLYVKRFFFSEAVASAAL